MISLDLIEELNERISLINYPSSSKYMLRYQDNTIFILVKKAQITTNYCRLDYDENSNDYVVRFYNFDKSEYKKEKIRIKKETLCTDLELILSKESAHF